MWSFLCSSLIRASTDVVPAGAGAGAPIASGEAACATTSRAAGDLVAAVWEKSPEAANKGPARTIAPSRVAAALAAHAIGCLSRIMMYTPLQLRLLKR